MSAVVNARDVLLAATTPRMKTVSLDDNVVVDAIKSISLTAPSSIFSVTTTDVATPSSIAITANLLFLTGTVTWSVTAGTATLDIVGNVATLTYLNMSSDTATIKASLTVDAVLYEASTTIAKVRNGATGERGDTGSAGSLTGYGAHYTISVGAWSDDLANRVIYNMLTGETSSAPLVGVTDHLMVGDTVTLSNGTTWAMTKVWDGNSWEAPGMVIDGNLIVTGTVSAAKLTAGVISTGYLANANITIGDTTTIGAVTSPFHTTKVTARANQTLISALNDKDDSVAIWGASAWASGNAVSGTWHSSGAEVTAGRWQLIGILGSKLHGAAVAGSVYDASSDFGGWFRYYTTASNSGTPDLVAECRLATGQGGAYRALIATGKVQLLGSASSIILGSSEGTSGQVLTSAGAGATPTWTTPSSGASYAAIQTALGGTTGSVLDLTTTFRSTGTNAPVTGSGLEVAYLTGASTGYLISCTRTAGGAVAAYLGLNIQGLTIAMNVTPTFPTPSTATNDTTAATTAYVVARVAQDAPSKTGSGASGTWGVSITGDAASVGGYKTFGGAGTSDGSGNLVINFPSAFASSTSWGIGANSTSGINVVVTAASASSVTLQTQNANSGAAVAGSAVRWTASGT